MNMFPQDMPIIRSQLREHVPESVRMAEHSAKLDLFLINIKYIWAGLFITLPTVIPAFNVNVLFILFFGS